MTYFHSRSWCLGIVLATTILALPACQTEANRVSKESEPVAEESSKQLEQPIVKGKLFATGSFEGRSDHVVSGGVEIIESNGQYFVQLGNDFSLDNAPDPKVGLGKDGYDPKTKSGKLLNLTGASSYPIPASVDIKAYNEVYIWCEKFDVPLGVAQLQVQ